jgi:hypothetical protein
VTKQEILERERRWAMPAAIAAMVGVVCVIASLLVGRDALDAETDAEVLRKAADNIGSLSLSYGVRALGFLLLIPPLVYLFRAAQARSERVRAGFLVAIVAGGLFVAASSIVTFVALDQVATDFVDSVPADRPDEEQERRAEDMLEESNLRGLSVGLGLGGAIGLGFGALYAALWAMRTGLMARFWGSLGMAVGAVFVFLPFVFLIWAIYLGLLLAGWLPRGRPPAWAAAEAMPWPKPGEDREREMAQSMPPPVPPSDPDAIEGQGRGVGVDGAEQPEARGERPRKRKRRS